MKRISKPASMVWGACGCVWLTACGTLLGIEDLKPATDASGGQVGSGDGGKNSSLGGSTDNNHAGGNAGSGSNARGGGNNPSNGGQLGMEGGAGGDEGLGGSHAGGTNGAGNGAGGSAKGGGAASGGKTGNGNAVTGTVIDFLGHHLANVPVSLADQTVTTDAAGVFTFADAPATYDLSLVVSPMVRNSPASYFWLYQGLTRRDPTLQVFRGADPQEGQVKVTLSNATFGTGTRTDVAFGSMQDGAFTMEDVDNAQIETSFGWYGSSTTAGRAHALRWTVDSKGLPTGYKAYKDTTLSLSASAGDVSQLVLDLADSTITSGLVTGTISSTSSNRENFLFARFTSNAWIKLVDDGSPSATFSYTAPSFGNAALTFVATDSAGGGLVAAHKDLAPGNQAFTKELPTAPILVSPTDGATVNAQTKFQWTTSAKVSVFHIEDNDQFRGVFIVTTQKQLSVPNFNGNYPLRAGAQHYWDVQYNNDLQSVDEAAGPSGFQDPFAMWRTTGSEVEPVGSLRGDGVFAISASHGFMTP